MLLDFIHTYLHNIPAYLITHGYVTNAHDLVSKYTSQNPQSH